MRVIFFLAGMLLALPASFRAQNTSAAHVIIHRSVQANNADWQAQPDYSFRRSDVQGPLAPDIRSHNARRLSLRALVGFER